MPQISLYIDDATLTKLEKAARKQRISISKWVAQNIRSVLDPAYPADFAGLFGSIADKSFARPDQPEPSLDCDRENL